jgi:threonine/homoserine/homoserine lactone efflux protein
VFTGRKLIWFAESMIGFSEWIVFMGASVLITLSPGPDNLLIVQQGVQRGRRAALPLAVGMVSGVSVHILLAVVGVSALIVASELVFNLIRLLGAGYLIYIGVVTLMDTDTSEVASDNTERLWSRMFFQGVTMNLLNPKVGVFFLAFLPGFVDWESFAPRTQMVALGVGFMLQAYAIFIAIALFASKFGYLISMKWIRNFLRYCASSVMVIIGASIVIELTLSIAL